MRIPILGIEIDERFFHHRQRSTSIAGLAGAAVAGGLFFYHYFAHGVLSWDLFAVVATMWWSRVVTNHSDFCRSRWRSCAALMQS